MNKTSLTATLVLLLALGLRAAENPKVGGGGKPLNILFIVADDCEWDSAGIYGCPIRDITPNIDRLAAQGARFMNAYSTVAVCQPVRMTMMTGLLAQTGDALAAWFSKRNDQAAMAQLRKELQAEQGKKTRRKSSQKESSSAPDESQ
jgi:N-sulfoglucosamine sulfohydrolase